MAPIERRLKYDAGFKLKVVAFAKSYNNCAAARKFAVCEKLVRDWRKMEASLKEIPSIKCAMRAGIIKWNTLEDYVAKWVLEKRQNGNVVTRNAICIYARKWAKENPEFGKDFKGTLSWCSRFCNRKDLVMRKKKKIAHKLPDDLHAKIKSFEPYVIGLRKQNNFPLSQIGNMDETTVNFDMLSNKTVDVKDVRTILGKSSEREKTKFTVVLSCMADGTKLKPMVILKRKTMPKIKLPQGVFVHMHPKGLMDEDGVKLWIEKVWNKRPLRLRKESSRLVCDMFTSHTTADIKKQLQRNNTEFAVIPDGLTSVLQPLDVSLNKPFKDNIRDQWNKWMANGGKTFTKSENMPAASLDVLCNLIIKAWESVKTETVIKSLKICSISNSIDGIENDLNLLWQDKDNDGDADEFSKASGTSSDVEVDPYDEMTMFMSVDNEEEFLGF